MKPPHIKAQREKEFRRISNRINKLYREIRELGYVELEKPIRHGWYRELIITENVWNYKNAKAILEIYDKIIPFCWGKTKEEAQRRWDERSSLFMISRGKPTISKKQFNKLSEAAKRYCVAFPYKTTYGVRKVRFYVNFPKGCSRFKYTRAYITHRKRMNPNLESELQYLLNQLEKGGMYELNSKGYWNRCTQIEKSIEEKKETRKLEEKLMGLRNLIISEELKEKLSWEIN
jgi:hypothetical protein